MYTYRRNVLNLSNKCYLTVEAHSLLRSQKSTQRKSMAQMYTLMPNGELKQQL